MRAEDYYILELCNYLDPCVSRLKELAREELDYSYILGKLLINRLGALAYHTFLTKELTTGINREFINTLKNAYISSNEKAVEFRNMLDELSSLLQKVTFSYALLKGSYLSQIYPKGTRTSNDIDIFIDETGIDALTNILLENGFCQGYVRQNHFVPATRAEIISARINRGETVPFIKTTSNKYHHFFEVDINTSFDYKVSAQKNILSKMLYQCERSIKTSHGYLYTFSREDFIIHLCCHLYKEASTYPWVRFGRDQGLYKYIDIYTCILSESNYSWHKLIDRITALGFGNECHYAFAVLAQMYGGVFEEVRAALKQYSTSPLNIIYDPTTQKTFCYDMDLIDWVFCNSKRKYLYEN
jgi:hypothetical protein